MLVSSVHKGCFMQPIAQSIWPVVLPPVFWILCGNPIDGVSNIMALDFVHSPWSADCCLYGDWWLVHMPGSLKTLILDRMPIIVLRHAAVVIAGRANYDITKANIVPCGNAAANSTIETTFILENLCIRSFVTATALTSPHCQRDKTVTTTSYAPMRPIA